MKRKKLFFVVALLLLVGVTSRYTAGTYAKYASEITGNSGTATVAKWAFSTDNPQQNISISLATNYNTSTLDSGKMAPGTNGSFNVQLVNTNTETAVDWTLTITDLSNDLPSGLKFYEDSNHTTEVVPGTSTITGTLAAKDSNPIIVPIYWVWEFGSSNDVSNSANISDTTAGTPTSGSNNTLSVTFNIKGVQHAPGTSAVTSGTN